MQPPADNQQCSPTLYFWQITRRTTGMVQHNYRGPPFPVLGSHIESKRHLPGRCITSLEALKRLHRELCSLSLRVKAPEGITVIHHNPETIIQCTALALGHSMTAHLLSGPLAAPFRRLATRLERLDRDLMISTPCPCPASPRQPGTLLVCIFPVATTACACMKNLPSHARPDGFLALLPPDARIFWIVTPVIEILGSSLRIGGRIMADQIAMLQPPTSIISTRPLTFRKGGESV
jgi:hypothetical protein